MTQSNIRTLIQMAASFARPTSFAYGPIWKCSVLGQLRQTCIAWISTQHHCKMQELDAWMVGIWEKLDNDPQVTLMRGPQSECTQLIIIIFFLGVDGVRRGAAFSFLVWIWSLRRSIPSKSTVYPESPDP